MTWSIIQVQSATGGTRRTTALPGEGTGDCGQCEPTQRGLLALPHPILWNAAIHRDSCLRHARVLAVALRMKQQARQVLTETTTIFSTKMSPSPDLAQTACSSHCSQLSSHQSARFPLLWAAVPSRGADALPSTQAWHHFHVVTSSPNQSFASQGQRALSP